MTEHYMNKLNSFSCYYFLQIILILNLPSTSFHLFPPYTTIYTSQLKSNYNLYYYQYNNRQQSSILTRNVVAEDIIDYDDDSEARSQFGTRQYWDDMYIGMGDFSSEEYSWYYGWDTVKPYFTKYVSPPSKSSSSTSSVKPTHECLVSCISESLF